MMNFNSVRLFLALVLLILCPVSISAQRDCQSLSGRWTLDYWMQGREPVLSPDQMEGVRYSTTVAMVPGNVELDLYRAGIITENPEVGSNHYLLRPYEGYQWRYSRPFVSPSIQSMDHVILDFEGVDCFAEVYVNGLHAGSTDNMLIAHRMDVTDLLNPAGQSNLLEVIIRSSVIEGRQYIPPTLSLNWTRPETVYVRRAPHTYGWDIMPRIVSAGLWRDVILQVEHPVHLRDVHWMTLRTDESARTATLAVDYTLSLPVSHQVDSVWVSVSLSRGGRTVYERTAPVAMHAERCKMDLEDVDLWWPRGLGEAALYEASVRLLDARGRVIDADERKVGIRTIRLERSDIHTADQPGMFRFVVNGVPVFIHGSNWTPLDAFHSRDPEHMERTLSLAVDLNCNMLRCWGGNVYEDTPFFDLCDREGIMVWQDFAMGCSFYPQDSGFQERIAREVRSVVMKLRSHACLALWAGNNEDDEMITDGTFSFYRPDPNRDVVTRRTIPEVLFELDPTRDYLPSSPYWSPEAVAHYDSSVLPERHLWGPRGYYKAPFYTTQALNLFASETGYHGMPVRESLERMFPQQSVYPWSDPSTFHWKDDWIAKSVSEYQAWGYNHSRNDLMINQVRQLFGEVPTDLDQFIFASESVQAEAMKFFVERFRGRKFQPATGILWWNVRDGWPLISDAVVDWYFNPKLAYYFIRNVQKDVCCMVVDREDGRHPLVVVNDTRRTASGTVWVRDMESGKVLHEGRFQVSANGMEELTVFPSFGKAQGMLLVTMSLDGGGVERNHYLYGEPPFLLERYRRLLSETQIYDIR